MPTPLKSTENMRKHLTTSERETRSRAEGELQRPKRIVVRAPAWLPDEALKIFESTKRQLRGLGLLDNTDAELLGLYADAIARYRKTVEGLEPEDTKGATAAQAWSRLALSFAEKLGISASARARLAKRKAEQPPIDDMDQLLSDVSDFVNGGVADNGVR